MHNLGLVVVGAYIAVFVWQAGAHRQYGWLLISVLSWLLLGVFSSHFLPGVMGILHAQNAFLAPLYVLLGSVTQWRRNPRPLATACLTHPLPGVYLSLLASTGWMMHLAWALLLLLVAWEYPHGLSMFAGSSLLQLYVWQPVFWMVSQWVLMLMASQSGQAHGRAYWQSGVLVALVWFALYVLADMLHWV